MRLTGAPDTPWAEIMADAAARLRWRVLPRPAIVISDIDERQVWGRVSAGAGRSALELTDESAAVAVLTRDDWLRLAAAIAAAAAARHAQPTYALII